MMAVSNEGHVYVSLRKEGDVVLLQDTDEDGVADRQETVANIEKAHGRTIHNGKLYIVLKRMRCGEWTMG